MARRTLLLTAVFLAASTLFGSTGAVAVSPGEPDGERRSEITIRGTYKAPTRISFEYSVSDTPEVLRVTTADSPSVEPTPSFPEPRLVKGSRVEADPGIVRPDRTVVDEFSLLELLGIGAGAATVLLLL